MYTSGSLDYETRTSYTIIVQATDTPEEGMEARSGVWQKNCVEFVSDLL